MNRRNFVSTTWGLALLTGCLAGVAAAAEKSKLASVPIEKRVVAALVRSVPKNYRFLQGWLDVDSALEKAGDHPGALGVEMTSPFQLTGPYFAVPFPRGAGFLAIAHDQPPAEKEFALPDESNVNATPWTKHLDGPDLLKSTRQAVSVWSRNCQGHVEALVRAVQGNTTVDLVVRDPQGFNPQDPRHLLQSFGVLLLGADPRALKGDRVALSVFQDLSARRSEVTIAGQREGIVLTVNHVLEAKDPQFGDSSLFSDLHLKLYESLFANGERYELFEQLDDDFAAWVLAFGKQCRAGTSRLEEIRAELAMMRREQKELRDKLLLLLLADLRSFRPDPDKGDLLQSYFTPEWLATMKKSRTETQSKIIATRGLQKALMDEGESLLEKIVQSAKEQRRKSGARRPAVQKALTHWLDQSQLYPIYFYEAAGWSNELVAATKDASLAEGASEQGALLMQAKAFFAQARDLEDRLRTEAAYTSPDEQEVSARLAVKTRPAAGVIITNTPAQRGPTATESAAVEARKQGYASLHQLLAINPAHKEARQMIQEIDLEAVRWIAAKLEREKQLSLAGFRAYMVNRGYRADDPQGLWDAAGEALYVATASGPVTVWNGLAEYAVPFTDLRLPGASRPGETADKFGSDQEAIASRHVSLLAIRRLLHNGMVLKEIASLSPQELQGRLYLQRTDGRALDPNKATGICQDIQKTFGALDDLRALAEGDLATYETLVTRDYFSEINAEQSWPEYLGDAFSPRWLLATFGPSAVVRVNGVLQWGALEAGALDTAVSVERGRDVIMSGLRLEKMGETLAKNTRLGGWLKRQMKFDRRVARLYSGPRTVAREGGKLASLMVIYGGAHHAAEESGVAGLTMFVDALAVLGGEHMAYDALAGSGMPPKMAARYAERLRQVVEERQAAVGKLEETISAVEGVSQGAGKTPTAAVSPADEQTLRMAMARTERVPPPSSPPRTVSSPPTKTGSQPPKGPKPPVETTASSPPERTASSPPGEKTAKSPPIGVDGLNDAEILTNSAAQSLTAGDKLDADKLTRAARTLVEHENEWCSVTAGKARAVADMLNREQALPDALSNLPDIGATPVSQITPKEFIEARAVAGGRPCVLLSAEADAALVSNDLNGAATRYQEAQRLADDSGLDELSHAYSNKRALAATGRETREALKELRLKTHAIQAAAEIDAAAVRSIPRLIQNGELKWVLRGDSINPVFEIQDASGKVLFYFKHLKGKDAAESAWMERQILADLFLAELGRELDFRVPAVARASLRGITVDITEVREVVVNGVTRQERVVIRTEQAEGILIRPVEGSTLWSLPEAVSVAVKDDYAAFRALSTWLAESDGHLKNFILGADGRLSRIDLSLSHLRRGFSNHPHFGGAVDAILTAPGSPVRSAGSQKDLMEATLKFPDFVFRRHPNANARGNKLYGWMMRLDQMIGYRDMAPAVKKIRAFARDENRLRDMFQRAWGDNHPGIDEAVLVLKERAESLEEVLRSHPGFGETTASLWPEGKPRTP